MAAASLRSRATANSHLRVGLPGSAYFARCTRHRKGSVALSLPGHQTERRRRFYAKAAAVPAEGGFAVQLDGRTPRSPTGAALVLPTAALAETVASEWEAQLEYI